MTGKFRLRLMRFNSDFRPALPVSRNVRSFRRRDFSEASSG